jgi:NADPH-dependent 7-cyano-7-deazaguanine reductase QueF
MTTTHLGHTVTHPIAAADIDLWPLASNMEGVEYVTDELQAVCPVTKQPDIYTARITYSGDKTLESKGVKLYLWGFRDEPVGCEDLAARIARELTGHLGSPVQVELTQQVRGGLTLRALAVGA